MKILFILPNNLGDVIMATPIIEGVKKRGCRELHFLVEKSYEGGILNNPYIDKIHLFERATFSNSFKDDSRFGSASIDLYQWVDTLNNEKYDRIINLSQHKIYATLTALLDAPQKDGMQLIGEGIEAVTGLWLSYLFSVPFARKFNKLHAIDCYKLIVNSELDGIRPAIYLSEKEIDNGKRWLNSHGYDINKKMIVLQPGAAISSKMWPIKNFIILAKELIEQGCQILITGAPQEIELCNAISDAVDEYIMVSAGELTFRETISLIPNAECVVTGDTAIMHAAAAVDTKVIALFGSTSPVETGPYGDGNIVFIPNNCEELPCFKHACDREFCMNGITVTSVLDAINNNKGDLKTAISHNGYDLIGDQNDCSLYVDKDAQEVYNFYAGYDVNFSAVSLNKIKEISNYIENAIIYLQSFENGDESAFEHYSNEIGKMQVIGGVADFIVTSINIGLNSISLVDIKAGITKMIELLQSYNSRIKEVIGA